MSAEKFNEDQPVEIATDELDEVAGGRKPLQTAAKPKGGGAGVVSDPCSGGE